VYGKYIYTCSSYHGKCGQTVRTFPLTTWITTVVDKIWLTADTMGSSGSVFLFPAWHEFLIGGGNCWLVFVVKDGLKFGAAGSRGVICGIMRWGLLFSESQSSSSKFFNGKLISILIIESAKLIAHDWPMQRGFS
jgi:hypothetical protein